MNPTTTRYLREISRLSEYAWLEPIVRGRKLDDPVTAVVAAAQIRARDPELDALLHTTISATMLSAGSKINVIPNTFEAQVDIRRTPSETREEVLLRVKQIINDPAIEITPAPGQQMPSTEPSSRTTALYLAMQKAISLRNPHDIVTPIMSRGATDGSYLRAHGMAVYGAPIFLERRSGRAASTLTTSGFLRRTSRTGSSCCGRSCLRPSAAGRSLFPWRGLSSLQSRESSWLSYLGFPGKAEMNLGSAGLTARATLFTVGEAALGFFPVDDVPPCAHILGPAILIFEV